MNKRRRYKAKRKRRIRALLAWAEQMMKCAERLATEPDLMTVPSLRRWLMDPSV